MINSAKNGNPLTPYTETTLPSGFTLVHKEVRSAPIVAIDIWIHTGAVHDPDPHFGLSHFYEHMFFKGTGTAGVGEMDRVITELGGYNNAATSYDYTHYYVVLPSAGWQKALEILIDSLLNPLFDPTEIERERQVIVEEIKRHEDNPWAKLYDVFTETAFQPSPYKRSILGSVESLNTINRETFQSYQQQRYCPGNITLSVVGDVGYDDVLRILDDLLPHSDTTVNERQDYSFELIDSPQERVLTRDTNQSYMLIGFPTPRLIGENGEYSMDLLSTILGDGRSSRLYRRLHDELGLVSSISSGYWAMVHAGLFVIDAVTEPEHVNKVEEEINSELQRLRERITPEELAKAKNMARADYAFGNEKAISIANTYGYSRVAADIEHTVHYLENLEALTIEDLQQAFDVYLTQNRYCKAFLLPKSS